MLRPLSLRPLFTRMNPSSTSFDTLIASNAVNTRYIMLIIRWRTGFLIFAIFRSGLTRKTNRIQSPNRSLPIDTSRAVFRHHMHCLAILMSAQLNEGCRFALNKLIHDPSIRFIDRNDLTWKRIAAVLLINRIEVAVYPPCSEVKSQPKST